MKPYMITVTYGSRTYLLCHFDEKEGAEQYAESEAFRRKSLHKRGAPPKIHVWELWETFQMEEKKKGKQNEPK